MPGLQREAPTDRRSRDSRRGERPKRSDEHYEQEEIANVVGEMNWFNIRDAPEDSLSVADPEEVDLDYLNDMLKGVKTTEQHCGEEPPTPTRTRAHQSRFADGY